MLLNEETLKKQIKSGEFCNLYLLYGNEGYLKQHYANTICSKTVSKDFEDFNLKKLDGKETSLLDWHKQGAHYDYKFVELVY